MSTEKYNPDTDIYANWNFKRDFAKLYIENQDKQPNPYQRHYLHPYAIKEERRKQIIAGFGFKSIGFWLFALGGLYAGGMIHARKLFINGGDFFLNNKFDFVGGKRTILIGLLLGSSIGSLLFGDRVLLDDYIKSRRNSVFRIPREKAPNDLIINEISLREHDSAFD